jgi:hypothetical protein
LITLSKTLSSNGSPTASRRVFIVIAWMHVAILPRAIWCEPSVYAEAMSVPWAITIAAIGEHVRQRERGGNGGNDGQ